MVWFQLGTIRLIDPPTHVSGRTLVPRVVSFWLWRCSWWVSPPGAILSLGLIHWHPCLCRSPFLLSVFVFVEGRVTGEPILPLHRLRDRTVLYARLTQRLFHYALYAPLFYLPIYYRARGASTAQAGAALVPFSIAFPVGSVVAGIVIRGTGRYKYLNRTTLIFILPGPLVILGTVATCTNRASVPLWPTMVGLGIIGLGQGAIIVLTIVVLVNAVDPADSAVVTSLSCLFRSTGSVVGLALASAVYQGALERDLWTKIGDLDNAADIIRIIKDSLINLLPGNVQWAVRSSYMVALRATFLSAVGFSALGLVAGFLIRELKLRSTLFWEEDGDETVDEESVGK